MRKALAISLLMATAHIAVAQISTSATQTIQLEIRSIAALEVSGDPGSMRITTGMAGSDPLTPVEENSTTYKLTTNATDMKLSVSINEPVPSGTRLFIEMGSQTGTSAGKVDISNALSPVDAVTGIGKGWAVDQPIVYTFEADADRQALSPQTRTVILTLTN